MASDAIEVGGLSFAYGNRPALEGIDLTVAPGEIVGLIGPNGSGKSTLIRVVSGALAGYNGRVRVTGLDVATTSQRDLARAVAVVPQEPRFGFPFTVLEIVLMGRHPHLAGLAFESEADVGLAREALERCGAAEFADRPIHELSAGERQRVVFARALTQQPRVLLLDEPASFLDIRHQVELYDLVRQQAREQDVAVLSVLHDLNLAAEYCDRIVLLREGRVAASGPTDEVFTYANLTGVFETEVYVDTNTLTGKLLVLPLSGRAQRKLRED
ncbi:MAG: heme ABC transporter ATP-binding protein [Acidobacteria bacterium]|nr:heme ABC transporter ATP-binding protein [Acidobacteriota bacterium]NIM62167.1 heme ABC transporter ATP-binding protein [Acidobacteriota bacterium]NIO58961.1 heme ABC transporter ATP-binding protein [Acidobacteriota bacterium]NIQ30007.1 heme ABC transporter ATP-binding protein [Acidobacteriota bacterium]NIQ84773.1 heme ABC transporter ATP-binding protein [Acidobacteriota bacterium]